MPPRYAYWTIIAGGLPTAFRAARREELLPTFHRIREKHPDAQMKWFARGRLWESPEAARADQDRRKGRGVGRPDGRVDRTKARGSSERSQAGRGEDPRKTERTRSWRPGGEHRDPRQPFKDAKKARNEQGRKRRFERRQHGRSDVAEQAPRTKPHGNPRPRTTRPQGFSRRRFGGERFTRNQGTPEPQTPPRPGPEPRPDEAPEPTSPPRPSEPVIVPPGPPERGKKP